MDFQKLLEEQNLDVLFVSKPENVRYLSGFVEGKDGKVVVTRDGPFFITDGRYIVEAGQQRFPHRILLRRTEMNEKLKEFFRGRIGVEAEHLSVALMEGFRKDFPDLEFVSTQNLIEAYRMVKTSEEVANIRKAAQIADAGFQHILPFIKPGAREVDIALELEFFCRRNGSEGMAFGITVASGVRGAQPHGGVSEKLVEGGELVTLDFGCIVGGYLSDMTRTVGVGVVSDKLRDLYESVLESQAKALEAVAPGRSGKELDTIARDVLTSRGYGEYFTHSLGHGVGLFIHEGPGLAQTSSDVLMSGNIVTIEPGAYIPGVGGCRIEDLALVRNGGHDVLSMSPKSFIQLPA